MYKVIKAQSDRTTAPFSPQDYYFASIIATENKANPATDKVYIDNRNHGLAWPESGIYY